MPYEPLTKEPMTTRALRFARALIVGAAATGADITVFTLCHRVFDMTPENARAPALLTGAIVQFFGNRTFTFAAGAGALQRHAWLFVAFESVGYAVNWFLYRWLVNNITWLAPELVTFIGTFLVFALYLYPVRRLAIFRLLQTETATDGR